MVEVRLLGNLVQGAADGADTIEVQADNIRELLQAIGTRYPKIKDMQQARQISVSIDGNIFRDNWQESIPAGAEICILPRIAGG